MNLKTKALSIGILSSFVWISCQKMMPALPESNAVLAEPIGELTPGQMRKHILGDEDFAHVFSELDGLGPIFVQNSCESCHVGDGKGNPFNNLTRFGRPGEYPAWDPVLNEGGPQLQHRSIAGYAPEKIPNGVFTSEFLAPNVTGLGYLEAVPDSSILAMADPDDLDGDGISGIYNEIAAPEWLILDQRYHQALPNGKYIGRFGRKAGAINLLHQTVGAYKQDMGITSDFDPIDPINYAESPFGGDDVVDPEISATTVGNVVFYLQTLEAPRRRGKDELPVKEGLEIFKGIGCEKCHKQTLRTGISEILAINEVEFEPYTDMLLHDMGPELDDGYSEGIVATSEWRTTPLWGLGLQHESQGGRSFLMHDGRARNYSEAIDLHGGEGAASREAFQLLPTEDKEKLFHFLNSL